MGGMGWSCDGRRPRHRRGHRCGRGESLHIQHWKILDAHSTWNRRTARTLPRGHNRQSSQRLHNSSTRVKVHQGLRRCRHLKHLPRRFHDIPPPHSRRGGRHPHPLQIRRQIRPPRNEEGGYWMLGEVWTRTRMVGGHRNVPLHSPEVPLRCRKLRGQVERFRASIPTWCVSNVLTVSYAHHIQQHCIIMQMGVDLTTTQFLQVET